MKKFVNEEAHEVFRIFIIITRMGAVEKIQKTNSRSDNIREKDSSGFFSYIT